MNALKTFTLAASMAMLPVAAQAAPVIFSPAVDSASVASLTFSGVTVSGFTYSATALGATPTTIANAFGTLTASSVRAYRTGTSSNAGANAARSGLGVCSTGDAQCNQVDTTGRNELLNIAFTSGYRIISAVFAEVDGDDTIRVFGVTGNALTDLGYANPAQIDTVGTSLGNGRYRVAFNPAGAFSRYIFATNNGEGDGFRLQSIETAVPEPTTWALMLVGFMTIGSVMRRRRAVRVSFA